MSGPLDLADDSARPIGGNVALAAEDDGMAGVAQKIELAVGRPEDRGLEDRIDAAEILLPAVVSQGLDGLQGVGEFCRPGGGDSFGGRFDDELAQAVHVGRVDIPETGHRLGGRPAMRMRRGQEDRLTRKSVGGGDPAPDRVRVADREADDVAADEKKGASARLEMDGPAFEVIEDGRGLAIEIEAVAGQIDAEGRGDDPFPIADREPAHGVLPSFGRAGPGAASMSLARAMCAARVFFVSA